MREVSDVEVESEQPWVSQPNNMAMHTPAEGLLDGANEEQALGNESNTTVEEFVPASHPARDIATSVNNATQRPASRSNDTRRPGPYLWNDADRVIQGGRTTRPNRGVRPPDNVFTMVDAYTPSPRTLKQRRD